MYLHMLDKDQQKLFLALAVLLKISDDELLWEGKTLNEITSKTNFNEVSFSESKEEWLMLKRYVLELDKLESSEKELSELFYPIRSWISSKFMSVYQNFKDFVSEYPIHKQNDYEIRLEIINKIFSEDLEHYIKSINISPESAKIIIYELQMLSLSDSLVSQTEENIIERLLEIFNIDDDTSEELLECAKETSKQVTKTLALILE